MDRQECLYYRVCDVPAHYRQTAEEALKTARRDLEVWEPIELIFFRREWNPAQGIVDNCTAYQTGKARRDWPMFYVTYNHDEAGSLMGLAVTWTDGPAQIRVKAELTKRELIGVVAHEARHIDEMTSGEDDGEDYSNVYDDWLTSEQRANDYRATKLLEYSREHPPIVTRPWRVRLVNDPLKPFKVERSRPPAPAPSDICWGALRTGGKRSGNRQ